MTVHVPDYYNKFLCRADRCKNTCCKDWEIDIDEKTLAHYMNVKGDYGDKIRNSIENSETPHFKLGSDKKCPLLTDRGLCSVYIELGEDKMCDICKLHPRFFDWYGNIKEGGVGLCCEEAAELIMCNDILTFSDVETDEENDDEFDDVSANMYAFLNKCRDMIYEHMQKFHIDYDARVSMILDFASILQNNIDNMIYEIPDINECRTDLRVNLLGLMDKFTSFDFLYDKNKFHFEDNYSHYYDYVNKMPDLFKENSDAEKYLTNIFMYFIMRYFMKGAYTDEILSSVRMAASATEYLRFEFTRIYFDNKTADIDLYIEPVCLFSSETEYSEENSDAFADMMYDEDFYM